MSWTLHESTKFACLVTSRFVSPSAGISNLSGVFSISYRLYLVMRFSFSIDVGTTRYHWTIARVSSMGMIVSPFFRVPVTTARQRNLAYHFSSPLPGALTWIICQDSWRDEVFSSIAPMSGIHSTSYPGPLLNGRNPLLYKSTYTIQNAVQKMIRVWLRQNTIQSYPDIYFSAVLFQPAIFRDVWAVLLDNLSQYCFESDHVRALCDQIWICCAILIP